jgi:tight adherence protein C
MPRKEDERSKIRARLLQAGYGSENAPATFFSIKIVSAMVLPAILLIAAAFYPRLTTVQLTYAALVAAFIGLTLPNMVLSWRIERRQREILNGFPDALDLIVACTEAGLGLNAALQRVANDIAVSHPELSTELGLVNSEIRAGVERVTALRNLATRTGIEDIRGLVSLLSQSLRFGTGIADTLRIYAHDLRDKRMQRAEEDAAKIGTKMIFPLIFCMFPAFFVVMVGPAVIGVLRVLQAH